MARLNLGSGANATITNVTGGNIVGTDGTSTVTTTNQITGGQSSNVTWLSIPTNTSNTLHNMRFGTGVNLELTNSGSIAFSNESTGTVAVIKGPPNTSVSNIYDTTVGEEDHFSITSTRTTTDTDDNVEQTYDIVSAGSSVITSGAIGDLSGVVTSPARYYTDTSTTPNTLYRVGTAQAGDTTTSAVTVDGVTTTTTIDFYSVKIETKAENAVITLGGLSLVNSNAPAFDNGANYTDNIIVQEKPFTVAITFPQDYGYAAIEFPDGTQQNTQVSNSYDNLTNFFSITSNSDGVEQTFDVISFDNTFDVSNGAISELKGVNRAGSDDRYYQAAGLIYRIGTEQTADESTDGDGNVTKFFNLIEENNVITLDQISLTADDILKVSCVKVGLAPFYASFSISGEDQTINVTPEIQDYSQTAAVPEGTTVTSVIFDTVTNLLDVICTNVRQEGNVMNNILTESIFGPGVNRGNETVEAMLFFESSNIYRTVNDAIFFNSDRVRLTSSTASTADSKETMAYFNPTTAIASDIEEKLYLLTVDDDFLGQSIIRTDFTTTDLTNELNRRKVTEGTLLNSQLNIPAFGADQ